jgi:hypothetical protein
MLRSVMPNGTLTTFAGEYDETEVCSSLHSKNIRVGNLAIDMKNRGSLLDFAQLRNYQILTGDNAVKAALSRPNGADTALDWEQVIIEIIGNGGGANPESRNNPNIIRWGLPIIDDIGTKLKSQAPFPALPEHASRFYRNIGPQSAVRLPSFTRRTVASQSIQVTMARSHSPGLIPRKVISGAISSACCSRAAPIGDDSRSSDELLPLTLFSV